RAAGRHVGDDIGAVAIGHAAVHTARGLLADVLLGQRQDEFLVVANPFLDRKVIPIFPLKFEETRDLTHRCHARASWGFAASAASNALSSASARRYSTGMTLRNIGQYFFQSARIAAPRFDPVKRTWRVMRMRSRSASYCVRSAEMSTRPCDSRSLAWPKILSLISSSAAIG